MNSPSQTVLNSGLADPSHLPPLDAEDGTTIHVIIETPKGSRNKYAFDAERKVFQLKRVLPVGMAFPYDFGFIPSTRAEDGDPVDVLVLMDEPAFPGCLLECRVIGVIEGEQGKKKQKERNDRIVAVEKAPQLCRRKTRPRSRTEIRSRTRRIFRQLSRALGQKIPNSQCEGSNQSPTSHSGWNQRDCRRV